MKARRGSALSAARCSIATLWFATVTAAALALEHPLALASLAVSLLLAGVLAGAGRALGRALAFAVPLAVTVFAINALVDRDGLTVVARLGTLPVVGHLDVTLEALAQSGTMALRVTVISLAVALFAACVDQDEVAGLLRRRSGRLGIVTALAARMVPLLAADGRRMQQARKSMPEGITPSRMAVFGAVAGGALDRAADAAATLELRGLGDGPCMAPRIRQPWSRHDLAIACSAAAVATACVVALGLGWLDATYDPTVALANASGTWIFALLFPLAATFPLLDRRGVGTRW